MPRMSDLNTLLHAFDNKMTASAPLAAAAANILQPQCRGRTFSKQNYVHNPIQILPQKAQKLG